MLDRASLAADARWPGAAIANLEPLPGGISSLTYVARLTGADEESGRVVIKVAPPGLAPVRNRDVLRQARVLKALRRVPHVLVPRVLLEDSGNPPGQPPFFVMEFIPGQAYEPKKDIASAPPDGTTVVRRAKAAARMLAHLHMPDPIDIGLGDEPALSPIEELERWAVLFATCEDASRGREAELYQRLRDTTPAAQAPRVLHGDYRIGNIQFDGGELSAVIDWEIWSLGDPRADLAWLLAQGDPRQRFNLRRDAANQAAADAVPHRDVLLREYLAVRPIDTVELDWFLAYCYYKRAASTAALSKRNRRRPDPDPGVEIAASALDGVIARGLEISRGALGGR